MDGPVRYIELYIQMDAKYALGLNTVRCRYMYDCGFVVHHRCNHLRNSKDGLLKYWWWLR